MKKVYLIAAILAVLAGLSLYRYMVSLENRYLEDYITVATAAVEIEESTVLTQEMIIMRELPAAGVHGAAVDNPGTIIGGIASQTIYQGEQILRTKIRTTGENEGKMSYSVPEGMRGVTISVDPVSGVSGFLRAMDRVDIILIGIQGEEENQKETAKILLEDVQILAIGTNPDSRKESYAPSEPVNVITLIVSPEDAVKLSLGSSTGRLTAALRSPADHSVSGGTALIKEQLWQ